MAGRPEYYKQSRHLFAAAGRELTFDARWTLTGNKCARNMAEAGFFKCPDSVLRRLKVLDAVICPYCEVVIGEWEPTDNPLQEHATWSPYCLFINTFPKGNSGYGELDKVLKHARTSVCSCGPSGRHETSSNSKPETCRQATQRETINDENARPLSPLTDEVEAAKFLANFIQFLMNCNHVNDEPDSKKKKTDV